MSELGVTVAVEGITDVPVARRLLELVGFEAGPVHITHGKRALDAQLRGFNHAAHLAPWFVLRDLNGEKPCAGAVVRRLLPAEAPGMRLRLAVHAVEAWLLADRERMAQFLAVPIKRVPIDPDGVVDPKGVLVNLARDSRRRDIREDLAPAKGTSARVGPGYTMRLGEYAQRLWRPDDAAQASRSLARCIAALRSWRWTAWTAGR